MTTVPNLIAATYCRLFVPSPSPYDASLGELSGNKFSIVVRGAKVPGRAVEASLQEACLGGFLNFFGTQRVGSPSAAARGQPLPYQASSFGMIWHDFFCLQLMFSRLTVEYQVRYSVGPDNE